MAIEFIPAIDQVVDIAIPEWHTTGSTVELRFSAVLGDEEFQLFKKNGMKVQIWSDIPLGGRNEGEWGEIDLHDITIDPSSDDSQIPLAALDDGEDKPKNLLSVVCSVLFSGNSKHFSFTYRVVYPSGEVKWLGHFGRNGTVHIIPASKNNSGIVLEEGWVANTAPFVWNFRERPHLEGLLIAQIAHPEDWFIKGSAANASLVLLVPRFRPFAKYCPKTVVLSASPDTTISVSTLGKIHAAGSGSLHLHTFNPVQGSADSFFDKIFAHSSSLDCRLLGVFGNYVGLASTSAASSIHAILVPLISSGFEFQIAIASASLANILGAETAEYTIFSEARTRVQFVNPVTLESGFVRFSAPPVGGLFILTPLYPIPAISKNEGSGPGSVNYLSLSVLSPHSIAGDAPVAEDAILPTPPPSPHLHPIAHLTSLSNNHSTTSISEHGDQDVVLGIPPIDDTQKDTIVSELRSLTLRPSIDQVSVSSLARRSSPSLLIESYRDSRENMIVAFMRHLYFVLTLWLSLMLRRLLGSLTSASDSEEQPSPRSPFSDTADGHDASPVNERTPLLPRVIPPSPVVEPSIRAVPSSPYVAASVPSQTNSSSPLASIQFDLLDAKSGPRGLILRDTSGSLTKNILSDGVLIELNGQEMPLNNVQWLSKDVVYLGIDWEKPGRVAVKLTSRSM
ncbi:hypothetical protein J3R30DRAFT_3704165 [Lentinula aciculospora]|uniref:Uncharacterized protein n=1 Tax=Lentinula aciculospora TaxID=153920 RepID=A0A9W9A865_9AGAR|nr:hypothetical protein J3R30DRAFT_3704165 [Lentinula aciculospora]